MARHVLHTSGSNKSQKSPAIDAYLSAVRRSAGPHVYVSFLGIKAYDTSSIHEQVRRGLPFDSLERLVRVMTLSMPTVAEILLIPPRTLQRRKESGRLRPDESDRLVRLSRIYGRAVELFEGDNDAAIHWLESPSAALSGATPLQMCQTEPGSLEVEHLIGRLEHGVFS